MSSTSSAVENLAEQGISVLRTAAHERSISILIDPVLADPLSEEAFYQDALQSQLACKIRLPVIHEDIDPASSPYLLHIHKEEAAERLIAAAVGIAAREALDDMGEHYKGRSVCAWVCGAADPWTLAARVATAARVIRPDGASWPLRLWDPRVMWHLPRVLSPDHWSVISSSLGNWWFISPIGGMQSLMATVGDQDMNQPNRTHQAQTLRFTSQQWQGLERIGPINKLFAMSRDWGVPETEEQAIRIDSMLTRCAAAGFHAEQDGLIFAACGLTSHERFDEHPAVKQTIEKARQNGTSLESALSQFDESFWLDLASDRWLVK